MIGNYDGASIYYEALIPSLQRLIASISDPLRKGKWTMVCLITFKRLFKPCFQLISLFTMYEIDSAANKQRIPANEGHSKGADRNDNGFA